MIPTKSMTTTTISQRRGPAAAAASYAFSTTLPLSSLTAVPLEPGNPIQLETTHHDQDISSLPEVAYDNWEMFLQRFFFSVLLYVELQAVYPATSQPFPVGLAHFFDLTFLSRPMILAACKHFTGFLLLTYTAGFQLPLLLPVMTLLKVSMETFKGSQGIEYHHNQLTDLVCLTQCVYYCRPLRFGIPFAMVLLHTYAGPWDAISIPNLILAILGLAVGGAAWMLVESKWPKYVGPPSSTLESHRRAVYYSIHTIAATYVVCGLSKVLKSGFFGWIMQTENFTLQMIMTERFKYYITLKPRVGLIASFSSFMLEKMKDSPFLSRVALAPGLLIELGAFMACFGRTWSLGMGSIIFAFHFGVYVLMDLLFYENMMVVTIYLIQSHYWIIQCFRSSNQPLWPLIGGKKYTTCPVEEELKTAKLTTVAASLSTYYSRLIQTGRTALAFWPSFLMIFLCLDLKENYPFSNFPMYAALGSKAEYIYIADQNGTPIPVQTITSHRTSEVKKVHRSLSKQVRSREKDKEKQKPTAAEQTLHWLLANCKETGKSTLEALRPLQLCAVEIYRDELSGEIIQPKVCYAEL